MNHPILVVDDDRSMCEMLVARLSKRGFAPQYKTHADDALTFLQTNECAAVVTDLQMAGMNGIDLCERIVKNHPNLPVIVITAFGNLDSAIAAIRAGAYDFINKPFPIEELIFALQRAIQHRSLREEVKRLEHAVERSQQLGPLLGQSPSMKKVFTLIEQVAAIDASVLIIGESGTGKELVAQALHQRSLRNKAPFVALSCAALPEHLLESELFGYKKGAFTDAQTSRDGLFVQAHTGTLFLDEIGDMPLSLQPKLLRALEERAVRPLGGKQEIPFDVRLISATHRDLEFAVENNEFRKDLYYRVNVVQIDLPPLRSRGSDILLLAQHFIDTYAAQMNKNVDGLSAEVANQLMNYHWPGNVRELRNCIERAVALAQYDKLTVENLPEKIRHYRASHIVIAGTDPSELVPLEEVEKRYILKVLEAVGGNRSQTAQVLGLDRKTLYRKLLRYGVADET